MVFEVYCDPCTCNSRKALAGLELLGTKFHFNHVDYFKREHKDEHYTRDLNPFGTVPSATDDSEPITESNAILMYAADRDGGHSAYPKDLKKRAQVNRWMLWEASVWFPTCYVFIVENMVKAIMKAPPDQSVLDAETTKWHKMATILDNQLAKHKWICGDEVTIADIALAAPMHLYGVAKLPLDEHPNLKRWMTEGIEQLPCWKKTQGPVDTLAAMAAPNGTNGTVNGPSQVRSTLNYTKNLDPKLTELYYYESEKAKEIHLPGDDPRDVAIHNGWDRAKDFSIDREGFSLHDFKTEFSSWTDDEIVKSKFYPEVVEFLKKSVGANRVLVFDHTIRTKVNDAKKITQETNTSQRAPIMLVHCDYTADSGPLRVRQLLPDEAEKLLSRRVAFINVWKPLHNIVEERPLAMCDTTSVPPDDFFKLHLWYRDRKGENYVMRYSPEHKWWYFPKMHPDQAILLKTYDSETDGRARFVGHSAFEDPSSPPNPPTRESIEIRTIVFF
ncbi:hypothetical protein NA57DRAFT_60436 [Rhizodiscina lignyota]|uniref:Glutathione S-transferase n=1 Tax=Rhizodiscina lignyota TaxID=1504668 RepID=A0A9P4M2C5_9PEZI|nr:hypothetical protein NA57DRAFT_60436 [Rhizodiscina lignyota]